MKSTFEKKYKSVWHCIVGKHMLPFITLAYLSIIVFIIPIILIAFRIGRNFGAYVTHEVGRYIYFYIG
jgi:hypothetical protein